jgi:hypothetical protein
LSYEDPIPSKTQDGLAELDTRRRGLSQRHRTLLLLIDGRRTVSQVRDMAAQAGVAPGCFTDLLRLGLIELHSPQAAGNDEPVETLPPTATLPPASSFLDSRTGEPAGRSSWFHTDPLDDGQIDVALETARELLLRTLRAEAPLAGTLTSLRLWRARSREDLAPLIEEVAQRVSQRRRTLSATLALQQARTLLTGPSGTTWTAR